METDFSFNNKNIKKYFEGDSSYIPARELLYIHSHPLIRPNFVYEIDNLVIRAGDKLSSKNIQGTSKWVAELETLCIKLGQSMPDVNIPAPEETLKHLRDIYILCNKILKA